MLGTGSLGLFWLTSEHLEDQNNLKLVRWVHLFNIFKLFQTPAKVIKRCCTVLHVPSVQCTALHCTALHYTKLQYTAVHFAAQN